MVLAVAAMLSAKMELWRFYHRSTLGLIIFFYWKCVGSTVVRNGAGHISDPPAPR